MYLLYRFSFFVAVSFFENPSFIKHVFSWVSLVDSKPEWIDLSIISKGEYAMFRFDI